VRSGVLYATAIIISVFVPLFALSGIEGRLFTPPGIAYIVSILASLVNSITVWACPGRGEVTVPVYGSRGVGRAGAREGDDGHLPPGNDEHPQGRLC